LAHDENKTLVQRHFDDVLNRCDLASVQEIYSEDVLFHGPEGMLRGKEAVAEWISNVHRAFEEFSVTVDLVIAQEDRVVVRNTARGYHRAAFMEMKASDRRVVLPIVTNFRIEHDKIAEVEAIYDSQIFVEELGTPVPLLNRL
jgi:steroid delta-isomerase-like uncharacterized protein